MNYLKLDQQGFEKFIQNYTDAVATQKDTFIFEGQTILTTYAKFLIEYYTPKIATR